MAFSVSCLEPLIANRIHINLMCMLCRTVSAHNGIIIVECSLLENHPHMPSIQYMPLYRFNDAFCIHTLSHTHSHLNLPNAQCGYDNDWNFDCTFHEVSKWRTHAHTTQVEQFISIGCVRSSWRQVVRI